MTRRVSTRNASVQVWQAYLNNRTKRHRDGRFLVQGVRPISQAVANDWPLETLLYRLGTPDLSSWARELLDTSDVPQVGLVPELMAELGEKVGGIPEVVAVAVSRQQELDTFEPGEPGEDAPVVVVFDDVDDRAGEVRVVEHGRRHEQPPLRDRGPWNHDFMLGRRERTVSASHADGPPAMNVASTSASCCPGSSCRKCPDR